MHKNLILTSIIALSFAIPVHANSVSADGNSIDNNVDKNTENNVNTTRNHIDELYNLIAGTYLPANSETATKCDKNGYYCAGANNILFDENNDQGLSQCPSEYDNTYNGATSESDCYRECTLNDVPNSTSVNGNYHYNRDNNCTATSCANGWYLKIDSDFYDEFIKTNNVDSKYACVNSSGHYFVSKYDGDKGQSYYGISNDNEWAVDFSEFGIVRGTARCSTQFGYSDGEISADFDNGQNCWCNVTGYRGKNESEFQSVSSLWLFVESYTDSCAGNCVYRCAASVLGGRDEEKNFQSNLFSVVDKSETCEKCPSGFENTASGINGISACYHKCTTNDIPHSSVVSGEYYYGSRNKQCILKSCASGWYMHKNDNYFDLAEEFSKASQVNSGTTTFAYINNNGSYYEDKWMGTSKEQSYYGISNDNEWATSLDDYAFGVVKGTARCSTQSGSYKEVAAGEVPEAFGNGQYCWCNITGYKAPGKTSFKNLSSAWVFHSDHGSADVCAVACVDVCANDVRIMYDFRSILFENVDIISTQYMCLADTITINWLGTDNSYINPVNAGMCEYGGELRTPVGIIEKPGKKFKGWRIIKPEQISIN